MRVTYDKDANAAYIYVVDPIKRGEAQHRKTLSFSGDQNRAMADFVLDFDTDGKLLGIEVLSAQRFLRDETLIAAEDITDKNPVTLGDMLKAERKALRSPNYASLTPQEQWEEDKRLGILDLE